MKWIISSFSLDRKETGELKQSNGEKALINKYSFEYNCMTVDIKLIFSAWRIVSFHLTSNGVVQEVGQGVFMYTIRLAQNV